MKSSGKPAHLFLKMLVPPFNFGIVEENLYRCSKLETLNFSFIENLGLKLIIFLMTEEPGRIFKEFMKSMKIEWIVLNPNSYTSISSKEEQNKTKKANSEGKKGKNQSNDKLSKDGNGGEESEAMESNNIISSFNTNQYMLPNEYGVNNSFFLIHPKVIQKVFNLLLDKTNNNILLVDKTALLIGMLRKVQKWQLSSILDEYRMITGKHKSYNAECFLEFVKIDIVQEKPLENIVLTEEKSKEHESAENTNDDEANDNDNETTFVKKREGEKEKLKIENQKNISQMINDIIFQESLESNKDLPIEKTEFGKEKMHILIDVDLENFEPMVPEYLSAMIERVDEETKRLEENAETLLRKFDELELLRKQKKKNKDINKYSIKFNKSKQETTQYEYYRSETKKHRSTISKRLTDTSIAATSSKRTLDKNAVTNTTPDMQGMSKQPFTRSSITFEPAPYQNSEEKQKNDRLTNEYGTYVANFSYFSSSESQLLPSEVENVSGNETERQIVVIKAPIENKLQDWFVQKRNVWEEENTFENHREIIYV